MRMDMKKMISNLNVEINNKTWYRDLILKDTVYNWNLRIEIQICNPKSNSRYEMENWSSQSDLKIHIEIWFEYEVDVCFEIKVDIWK